MSNDIFPTHLVRGLLRFIGEDPDREGLRDTPDRVLKAWKFWTQGYSQDPKSILKVFEDGSEGYDEMVIVKNIDVFSQCEHHLAPFFGKAAVAYIPKNRIVGISKLARVVEVFSRRLQVQERMTTAIADAIDEVLQPDGVGVIIEARHMCMCSRGVQHTQSGTVTSALRGSIKDEPSARSEFFRLAGY